MVRPKVASPLKLNVPATPRCPSSCATLDTFFSVTPRAEERGWKYASAPVLPAGKAVMKRTGSDEAVLPSEKRCRLDALADDDLGGRDVVPEDPVGVPRKAEGPEIERARAVSR